MVHVLYGCLFGTYATIGNGGISYVIQSSWRYNNDNNQQLNTSHPTDLPHDFSIDESQQCVAII